MVNKTFNIGEIRAYSQEEICDKLMNALYTAIDEDNLSGLILAADLIGLSAIIFNISEDEILCEKMKHRKDAIMSWLIEKYGRDNVLKFFYDVLPQLFESNTLRA